MRDRLVVAAPGARQGEGGHHGQGGDARADPEACLTAAVDEIRRETGDVPLDRVPAVIAAQVAAVGPQGPTGQLMLLLRSSGDERAEEIRRGVLRTSAERLAAAAGWRPGDDDTLLRAQVVLAAALGIVLLRASGALEPLQSAGEENLTGPLREMVGALLDR
ncbi:hypothetical protein [Dactylosporangium salmoneum]|uniref:Tetracyclin repressor-like C-terminal domain-containing protein n=1 Tax=Dactylosporangium salmoneum TaxID=53361 RepID=A0ABN3FRG6_9ACTN